MDGHNISRSFRWTGEDTVTFRRTSDTHKRFIRPESTLGQLDFATGSLSHWLCSTAHQKKTNGPWQENSAAILFTAILFSLPESFFALSHTSKNNKDAPDLTHFFFLSFFAFCIVNSLREPNVLRQLLGYIISDDLEDRARFK